MKKRIISCLLVFCILFSLFFPVNAVQLSNDSFDVEMSKKIVQMVSQYYYARPGQYSVGDAISIYNADSECVYYIVPIFCNQECVGIIELDMAGHLTLIDNSVLYTAISELTNSEYLLYTSGGIVYAESQTEVVEVYDSGLDIPINDDFLLLPYIDKLALAKTCIKTVTTDFDVDDVVEAVVFQDVIDSEVSLFAQVPVIEGDQCGITNFVTQNGYNLCWAACVATIANYKKNLSLTAESVANAMGHDYTNDHYLGAYPYETLSAFANYDLTYNFYSNKLSWNDVKSNIATDKPFVMRLYNDSYGGHLLTVYGYSCQYGDSEVYSSSRSIQVWDPNGSRVCFSYSDSYYTLYGNPWTWTYSFVD